MKHTIWTSTVNLDEWDLDDICYNFGIDADDIDKITDAVYDMNKEYLNDELDNLDITIPNGLVVFGNGGRWNGRRKGVVSVDNTNISDCLDWENHWEDMDIIVDDDLTLIGYHHDGTDYYTVRKWNSLEDKEKGIEALENGMSSDEVKERYTSSVADIIGNVYGW